MYVPHSLCHPLLVSKGAGEHKEKGLAVSQALLFFLVELDGIEPTTS